MAGLHKVALKTEIKPGDAKIVRADGAEIALFNVGGKFYAVENACPHRGAPLAEGALEGCMVTCPWHGWQFDVTTGALAMNPASKIKSYKVHIKGEEVHVEA